MLLTKSNGNGNGTLALALLLVVAGCQRGSEATRPPERYTGDTTMAVQYVSPEAIGQACANSVHEPGVTVIECYKGNHLVMVNPCFFGDGSDPYAQVECHGKGHWLGWPANHPKY